MGESSGSGVANSGWRHVRDWELKWMGGRVVQHGTGVDREEVSFVCWRGGKPSEKKVSEV